MEKLVDIENQIQECLASKDYDTMYELLKKVVVYFVRNKRIVINNRYDNDFTIQLVDDYCMYLIQRYNSGQPVRYIYRTLELYYARPLTTYLKNEVPGYSAITEEQMLELSVAWYSDKVSNKDFNEVIFIDILHSLPNLIKDKVKRLGPLVDKVSVLNTYLSILFSVLKDVNSIVRLPFLSQQYFPLVLVSAIEVIKKELKSVIGDIGWVTTDEIMASLLGENIYNGEKYGD